MADRPRAGGDRLLAEFATEDALADAIRALRRDGYERIDAYLPFASHVVEHALARPRSRLPIAVFCAGVLGAGGAYLLQWWLVAHLYPLVVGGRPPHFPLAFVIITFEMGVLVAGLTAFAGVLALARMVRLVDEVQGTPGFESATGDRFWLEVGFDREHDHERVIRRVSELGPRRVELPEDRR